MPEIRLEPWHHDDLPLLTRFMGDAEMTRYLGGPETPAQLQERHERYLRLNREGTARMSRIVDAVSGDSIGSIGYWQEDAAGAWETGWAVDRAWQGQGIATAAIRLVQEASVADTRVATLHAYPGTENLASNAICRKTGFVNRETLDVEFPAGNPMRVNHWVWQADALTPS